jgi:hypothetical protein
MLTLKLYKMVLPGLEIVPADPPLNLPLMLMIGYFDCKSSSLYSQLSKNCTNTVIILHILSYKIVIRRIVPVRAVLEL